MKSKYVKKHECVIIGGGAAGVHVLIEQPLGLHLLECGLHVVVVDITDRQWQV